MLRMISFEYLMRLARYPIYCFLEKDQKVQIEVQNLFLLARIPSTWVTITNKIYSKNGIRTNAIISLKMPDESRDELKL